MSYYLVKLFVSAGIIVLVTEVGKKSSFFGALILSLPLVSLLSFIWLYLETKDVQKIQSLAFGTFWLVLPSLAFFLILPLLLKANWNFAVSLLLATILTGLSYLGMISLLKRFGISL